MGRSAYQHLYKSARWERERKLFLNEHPICEWPGGCNALSRVVDHKKPHKGDETLFWDQENWQALCKACHDGPKQQQEKSGTIRGCDEDGNPIDPNHAWNKKKKRKG